MLTIVTFQFVVRKISCYANDYNFTFKYQKISIYANDYNFSLSSTKRYLVVLPIIIDQRLGQKEIVLP